MSKQRMIAVLAMGVLCAAARAQTSSSQLMRELTTKTTVTRGDCMDACAALLAGPGAPTQEGAVVHLLRAKHVLRGRENEGPSLTGTRGFACLLFARALGESGGVMRTLLPSSEHYAYRHMEYLGLIPAGGSGRPITGLELVSLLALSRKRVALRGQGER